ncbi:hypothetical protein [Flavobacterium phragmitis]|uniref:Uncharacterized protein n=1 Tax=Flavobacterium phragmitis TaxID=739143 RepID=A0A1I1K185_9FLAO|nr:hypothetical protein [Flavobacterium phragmitis]SFC51743.1 hypothetical protein SAMN05216297_10199 [Flavobacterium phragmitis]
MMFDLLTILKQHTAVLENNLKELNLDQGKSIAIAFAQFYFLMPDVTECLENRLGIKTTKDQFIKDL